MKTINLRDLAIDNKNQYKIFIGLALFYMVMNLLNRAIYSSDGLELRVAFSGLAFGLASAATYSALILIIDRPFIGLCVLCVNYFTTAIGYVILGDGQEALEENIMYAVVVGVVLLLNYMSNRLKKRKDNMFKVERLCIKLPIAFKIILYSSMLTVIFLFAKTEQMSTFDSSWLKIYGAIVALMPFYFMFGILTTTVVAYDIFVVKIIIEFVSFVLLSNANNFNAIMLMEILAEVVIAIYWFIRYSVKYNKTAIKIEIEFTNDREHVE